MWRIIYVSSTAKADKNNKQANEKNNKQTIRFLKKVKLLPYFIIFFILYFFIDVLRVSSINNFAY